MEARSCPFIPKCHPDLFGHAGSRKNVPISKTKGNIVTAYDIAFPANKVYSYQVRGVATTPVSEQSSDDEVKGRSVLGAR